MSEPKQPQPPHLLKKVKVNSIGTTIDVYCRFRPVSSTEKRSPYYIIDTTDNFVELDAPDEVIQKNSKIKKYSFTQVFAESSTQEDVFDCTIKNMVSDLFNSRMNGVVFSYGVTNAGKTHTIIGNKTDPGLLPKLFCYLMEIKDSIIKKEMAHRAIDGSISADVEITFESFEIYNEEVFDLNPIQKKPQTTRITDRPKLKVRDGQGQGLIIEELQKVLVSTSEEAIFIIDTCLRNRQMAATSLNSSSSRSHSVFKINVGVVYNCNGKNRAITESIGHICVVDLAGSERAKRTESTEPQLKEACAINKSLMVLGRCFQALKNKQVIPFRDSKLTRLLSEFFKHESRIKIITNINPREDDFSESLRVLNYASLAKEMKLIQSSFRSIRMDSNIKKRISAQQANQQGGTVTDNSSYNELFSQIEERDKHGGLHSRGPSFGVENQTQVQGSDIARKIRQEIANSMEDLGLLLKRLFQEQQIQTENALREIRNETATAILTERIKLGDKEGVFSHRNTPSKTSRSSWKVRIAQNSKIRAEIRVEEIAENASRSVDPILSKPRRAKPAKSTPKSGNSDGEINPKRRAVVRIKQTREIPPSAKQLTDLASKKKVHSAFYESFFGQTYLEDELVFGISREEYLREEKGKYLFLLEVCGNDIEEANQWFRNELNRSPPRLTTKERQDLISNDN